VIDSDWLVEGLVIGIKVQVTTPIVPEGQVTPSGKAQVQTVVPAWKSQTLLYALFLLTVDCV